MRDFKQTCFGNIDALPVCANRFCHPVLISSLPACFLISHRTLSISVRVSGVVLWMMWRVVVDTLCGRRRRMPRSLSFLLLFTAGGLLLFIKQKDLSEMVQQLYPPGQSPLWAEGRSDARGLGHFVPSLKPKSSLSPNCSFPGK